MDRTPYLIASHSMRRSLFLMVWLLATIPFVAQAQRVGVNTRTPHPAAALEVAAQTTAISPELGMLIPRVNLVKTTTFTLNGVSADGTGHVAGMVVYNLATSHDVRPGFYYNDGTKWVRVPDGVGAVEKKWYYMPSINFDTSTIGATHTVDLYAEFQKQMAGTVGARRFTSAGAPAAVFALPAATALHYYVIDYDTDVFDIQSLSATGVLTYKVKAEATEKTYINIVFLEK